MVQPGHSVVLHGWYWFLDPLALHAWETALGIPGSLWILHFSHPYVHSGNAHIDAAEMWPSLPAPMRYPLSTFWSTGHEIFSLSVTMPSCATSQIPESTHSQKTWTTPQCIAPARHACARLCTSASRWSIGYLCQPTWFLAAQLPANILICQALIMQSHFLATSCLLSCTFQQNSKFHWHSGQNLYLDLEWGRPFGTGHYLSSIWFFLQNHLEEPKIHWTSKFTYKPIILVIMIKPATIYIWLQ